MTEPNSGKTVRSIWRSIYSAHPLALCVTAADEQGRAKVSELARRVQAEAGEIVKIVYVDQGYTGENAADAAEGHGIMPEVVKLPAARRALCCCHADG